MKTYFASALLVAAKAVDMNRDYYRNSHGHDHGIPTHGTDYGIKLLGAQSHPGVYDGPRVKDYKYEHYEPKPLYDFNFSRIFDAAQEVYFGTDSESDIDGDSHTEKYGEKDSYSDSGSSLGLSGPGYTHYSGSDSGTESSSHHSHSTILTFDHYYKNG